MSPSNVSLRLGALLLILAGQVTGKEVCYNELGCFSDESPWSGTLQRLRIPLPWTPEKINTRFLLLTRQNPNQHQELHGRDVDKVTASLFQTSRKTCFIIHGMSDRAENNWVPILCREILRVEDVNCIGVDWHHGSGNLLIYPQSTSNVRVVGAEVAHVLRRWQEDLGYSPGNVHIIGHSLGAHVAGEAGRRLHGIRRITGLDPARLHFEYTPQDVSLDASDADFVDVIHTDTDPLIGLGMIKPVGHFDFYPNGGRHMTGCRGVLSPFTNMNALIQAMACNHLRSIQYYTESIRSPRGFLGYPCPDYDTFMNGFCFPCPVHGCPSMGHFSESFYRTNPKRQTFSLNTGGIVHRFSSYRYKIFLSLAGEDVISGQILVSLFDGGFSTVEHVIVRGTFQPGATYFGFIDSDVRLDAVSSVNFRWILPPVMLNFRRLQLGAERIDVQSGENGAVWSFCTSGTVKDNVLQMLGPCIERPVLHLNPNSADRANVL